MKDGSPASFAAAEQEVRNLVTSKGAKDCSEMLYFLPDDTVVGESRINGSWPGAAQCDLSVYRPRGISRLYVLSAYADMDKVAAKKMLRPLEFIAIGRRIGREAATLAKTLPTPDRIDFRVTSPDSGVIDIDFVGEDLRGLRASKQLGMIHFKERELPVFGQYDVVVVGGGTSGAPAGISASRRGSKTLVIEYLDELGGTGTAGLIGSYWRGNRRGFTKEINDGIGAKNSWDVVAKSEWLRLELIKNGADVWFCSFGCGAVIANGRVKGVVVATPQGRGVVLAKTVIDATGNSDIAFCAGAETQFGVSALGVLSVQLAGFPHRNLGDNYNNTCYTMVDDTDVVDVWHLMTSMRIAYSGREVPPYDVGQLVDSRERRRIIGEYRLTAYDILNQRTHPDTISQHMSNFDAAAFPDSEMLLVYDMKGPDYHVDMPYRCLIPKGLDGILVTGLGASVERDAMTLVRMQADLQNQGYAAGMAAAMAAKLDGCTRKIDIKKVQQQMIKEGVLEPRVIHDRDSYPMDESIIARAVEDVKGLSRQHDQSRTVATKSMKALAVIMAHPERSKSLLREAYKKSSTRNERINYAKILSILGDNIGVPVLIAEVDGQTEWDEGYPYTAGRKVGNVFSDLDRWIIALGYSGDPRALESILRKTILLKPETVLSHYKAVTFALRRFRDSRAIEPLVTLLQKPGFGKHAVTQLVRTTGSVIGLPPRRSFKQLNAAFKEIIIAATLYQCGDYQKMGRTVLEQYSQDVNGHFASFAQAILNGKVL